MRPSPCPSCVELAPAEISARHERFPERHELLARAAGIVRDDRVLALHHLHEVVDHAVLVDRGLGRGELSLPLFEPFLLDRAHFLGRAVGALAVADFSDERLEHELRVADAGGLGRKFLADIGGIVGEVHDLLAVRHLGPPRRAREARAHRNDAIGLAEEVVDHLGRRHHRGAERERMVLGKGALAGVGRKHRRIEQLGELHELLGRACVKHALARMDDRRRRFQQHFSDRLYVRGIRPLAIAPLRRVVEGARLGLHHVSRDLDQNRARLAVPHEMEGAPHELKDARTLIDARRPLGDGAEALDGVEGRRRIGAVEIGPARQQQHRHVVAIDLSRAGKGVFDAGAALHRKDAGLRAVGRAADPVGNADADTLLPADHGFESRGDARIDQELPGIAHEILHPFGHEHARDRFGDFHANPLISGTAKIRAVRNLRPGS